MNTMKENEEMKFYRVEEIAEMLFVTKQTVYKYITDGKLEAVKVGNKLLISEESLRKFLDSVKVK